MSRDLTQRRRTPQDAHREPFVQDTPLLLEIIHEIFKGHEPADLATLGDPLKDPVAAADLKIRRAKALGDYGEGNAATAKRPDARLVQLMEKENQAKTVMPNRHARFGGVYRRQYDVSAFTTSQWPSLCLSAGSLGGSGSAHAPGGVI